MRISIYGTGQLAAGAIRALAYEGEEITVFGKERSELERLSVYPGVTTVLIGELVMQEYLQNMGFSHTDAFMALSNNDHENLLLAQAAKHIFSVERVVCHLEDPQLEALYRRLGLKVLGYSHGILEDLRQEMEPRA